MLNICEAFSAGVVRETTKLVIDKMFSEMHGGKARKPRCNRDKARNLFLVFIKKKKPKKAEIR